MLEYRLLHILFLAIGQVLKILWHFEILNWENPKICNILKTADLSVKRLKIWKPGVVSFHVRSFEFSLGSFGVLCKIPDVKI